jgi:hypothetical protein
MKEKWDLFKQLKQKQNTLIAYDAGNGKWVTDLENIPDNYKPKYKALLIEIEEIGEVDARKTSL